MRSDHPVYAERGAVFNYDLNKRKQFGRVLYFIDQNRSRGHFPKLREIFFASLRLSVLSRVTREHNIPSIKCSKVVVVPACRESTKRRQAYSLLVARILFAIVYRAPFSSKTRYNRIIAETKPKIRYLIQEMKKRLTKFKCTPIVVLSKLECFHTEKPVTHVAGYFCVFFIFKFQS